MNYKLSSVKTFWIIFLVYVAAISVLSFFHEYWRDELQPYMLVRGSNSIRELLNNSRYEGHPSLWFIMLFGLKIFGSGMLPMKVLHLLIASLTAWIILRYGPFKTLQKILLLSGYFFFYEYVFIVRNYAIGLLFIVSFCALFPYRQSPKYFFLMALTIVGMMLSNFYSFFIGIACMSLLAGEHIFYHKVKDKIWKLLPAYAIMLAGIILFLLDTTPPPDYGYASGWNTVLHIEDVMGTIARVCHVFIPIPILSIHFWNSTFISGIHLQAIIGFMIIVMVLYVFSQNRLSFWFMLLNFGMLLGFSYVKFNGFLRHNGHIYIAFIAMLWLQHYLPGKSKERSKLSGILLYTLLSVQVVAMFIAVGYEVRYPFSQAKNAAFFIERNYPNNIVVAHQDIGSSSVCAYLKSPFYYPLSDRFGTYLIWDDKRQSPETKTSYILHKGDSLKKLYHKEILYLSTYPIDSSGTYRLKLQQSFTPSIEPVESYYIYTKQDDLIKF
jgi:hypothetical protein